MEGIIWVVVITGICIYFYKKKSEAKFDAAKRYAQNAQRQEELQQKYRNMYTTETKPNKGGKKKSATKSRTTDDLRKTDDLRDVSDLRGTADLRDTSDLRKFNEADCEIHEGAHVAMDHTGHIDPIDVDSSQLMDAVYDAMICGPSFTLPSDRDFVAEGMDFIANNSIS